MANSLGLAPCVLRKRGSNGGFMVAEGASISSSESFGRLPNSRLLESPTSRSMRLGPAGKSSGLACSDADR